MSMGAAELGKHKGRRRAPGKRTPSGQLSREGRDAAEALAPGYLKTIEDAFVRDLMNPLYRSQMGLMRLRREITVQHHEAGKRFRNLNMEYQEAMGSKLIKPVSFQRLGASFEPDPASKLGMEIAQEERAICQDFEDALRALYVAGREAVFAVRQLCEEDRPLSWEQKPHVISGLDALCEHWGLTKSEPQRRK